MDAPLNPGNIKNNTSSAAPAPPSAVMQALQSFQAAAEASSKGTVSSQYTSGSNTSGSNTNPQQCQQYQANTNSITTAPTAFSQIPLNIAAGGSASVNAQQHQQRQQQQQQLLQGAIQGLPFMMTAATASTDPQQQQLWLQQALQTLATVQLQQQQPQAAPAPAVASASSKPPTMPPLAPPAAAIAPVTTTNVAQQQQLFQLQNLLTLPLQQQQQVQAAAPTQQQPSLPSQTMTVGASMPSSFSASPPYAPPAGRKNKRRKENPPAGSTSGPSIISVSNSSLRVVSNKNMRINSNHHHHSKKNKAQEEEDDKPPQEKSSEELEKMTPSERRRYERNLREQQRSYKISQQIKQLREVLQESNIPFRPNKYSILVSVADHIKQLQGRAIMLDSEHQRLIDTIRQTNDLVTSSASNGGGTNSLSALSDGQEDVLSSTDGGSTSDGLTPHNLLLVQGIDYMAVFRHCPYPIGVATLDGRMLDCNRAFEELLQVQSGSLKDQSFFAFIRNHQEIFQAMAALLKQSSMESETGLEPKPGQEQLFWNGELVSQHNERYPFTITLTNGADENPIFFSLSAAVSLAK